MYGWKNVNRRNGKWNSTIWDRVHVYTPHTFSIRRLRCIFKTMQICIYAICMTHNVLIVVEIQFSPVWACSFGCKSLCQINYRALAIAKQKRKKMERVFRFLAAAKKKLSFTILLEAFSKWKPSKCLIYKLPSIDGIASIKFVFDREIEKNK